MPAGVFIGPNDGGGTNNVSSEIVGHVINQTNSFQTGQVIRFDPISLLWILAQANTANNSEWTGVIYSATTSTFVYVISGYVDLTGAAITFIPGDVYYLSDTTPGLLQGTEPASPSLSAPVFFALTSTTGIIRNHRVTAPANGNTNANYNSLDITTVFGWGVRSVNSNTVIDGSASTIYVDASVGNVTLTLPAISSAVRRFYNIKKIDSTNNLVIILPNGTDTLDGQATQYLWLTGQNYNIQANFSTNDWICNHRKLQDVGYAKISNVNFNVTTDQVINIPVRKYIIRRITVNNISISLTTAAGGIYTGASKTGLILVAASQVYSALTAAGLFLDLTLNTPSLVNVLTAQQAYFSLTTAQGVEAIADIVFTVDILQY